MTNAHTITLVLAIAACATAPPTTPPGVDGGRDATLVHADADGLDGGPVEDARRADVPRRDAGAPPVPTCTPFLDSLPRGDWTLLPSPAVAPRSHSGWFELVHDPYHHVLFLFGMCSNESGGVVNNCLGYCNDVWVYDIGANTWELRHPSDPSDLADHCTLDPAAWDPSFPSPRHFYEHIAFDRTRNVLWLAAGGDRLTSFNDLWTYDVGADVFEERLPHVSECNVQGGGRGSVEHDPIADELLYFSDGNSTCGFGGFRHWYYAPAANAWTSEYPADAPPRTGRTVYAPDAHAIYMLVPEDDGLWRYDLAPRGWHHVPTPAPRPSARKGDITYDEARHLLLVFGGEDELDDTWTYDVESGLWSELSAPTSPAAGQLSDSSLLASIPACDVHVVYREEGLWFLRL